MTIKRYHCINDAICSLFANGISEPKPFALWGLYSEPVNCLGQHPVVIAPSGIAVPNGTMIKDYSNFNPFK